MTATAEATARLSISGMSCAGCVATVENALKNVPGVTEAAVNFAEHTATVHGNVDPKALVAAVSCASGAQRSRYRSRSSFSSARFELIARTFPKIGRAGHGRS